MRQWWEIAVPGSEGPPKIRAVAYYRHSAQDRQENSIPIQRDQVREWADKNGVEIVHEFADAGKSGLNAEGRPAFTEMMNEWVKKRSDFDLVLCLDVSRWGRFQDIDLSAQYSAECKKAGKQVIYTTIGKPREDDPLYPVYVQFERFRAAQYSRELSDKVWRGCVRIAQQGYWAGGKPPYGLQRLLLDESREPVHILETGQRKGIQNQRVTLIERDQFEAAVIRRIFHEFVDLGYSEFRIAEGLNRGGILAMPATLATTSLPNRTSPVRRGVWVLEQILGERAPPPPPDVPELEEQEEKGVEGLTLRERTELHRTEPTCANCHKVLDPIGFGLENFDAIGRWREKNDAGIAIDSAGELPNGESFSTPAELKGLVAKREADLARNLTERLMAYALGRQLEGYDEVVVDQLMVKIARDNYRVRTMITEVITSYLFTHRRVKG